MLPTLIRRMAQQAPKTNLPPATPFTYKLKKVWPPDFKQLSPQAQLKFEKRYKRRVQRLAERPKWNKFVKLTQLGVITFVIVYSVLFMDWRDERQPFDNVRAWFWEYLGMDGGDPIRDRAHRLERRKDEPSK